jgi:hypothetical protein
LAKPSASKQSASKPLCPGVITFANRCRGPLVRHERAPETDVVDEMPSELAELSGGVLLNEKDVHR